MDSNKWNNVLIEWINCLKLSKTVHNVDDLRNEEFFTNLQKVITKSSDCQDNLTFIFNLFTRHYPKYSVENKTEIHINDVLINDLKAITSLLMHYTCVYDRKDVLTSPLCHTLSQSTQRIIRKFLEKVTGNVTRGNLDAIIVECITNVPENSANRWLSVGSSDDSDSPLQDILKTPVSKFGRLQEKDRLINKLKSELEVEKYERADLQEELKLQIDKTRKIEKQLGNKSKEISKLRGEVIALENRTPPHYQDIDSRNLQRRLRSEIQSLEQYVQQIEKEQDEIRKEKDAAKEKLRCFESQCIIWQQKFFETERNFEELSKHSKQRDLEFESLKTHCDELTALLDEYKNRTPSETSFYDNYVEMQQNRALESEDYEDLACSVVEVQLRDALKLNEEFKEKIDELEDASVDLKDKIEDYVEDLTKNKKLLRNKQKQFKGLLARYDIVAGTLVSFKDDLFAIRGDHENAKSYLKELQVSTMQLVEECSLKLQEGEESYRRITEEKNLLLVKVAELESKCVDSEKQLFGTRSSLESLNNYSKQQQIQISNLELNYAKLESCHESTQRKLQTVCEENENRKNRLDEAFNSVKELKEYLEKSSKSVEVLRKEKDELLLMVENLDTAYETCQKDLDATKAMLADATLNLEQSQNDYSSLSKSHSDLIALHDNTNKQLKELIVEREQLKNDLVESQNVSSNLSNDLTKLKTDLEEKDNICTSLLDDNQRLTSEFKTLETNFVTIQEELNQTRFDLTTTTRNFEKSENELVEKREICAELTQVKVIMEETLKISEHTNKGLNVQLGEATNENAVLRNNCEELTSKLASTVNDLVLIQNEFELLRDQRNRLQEELKTFEHNHVVVQNQVSLLKDNLRVVTEQLEEKKLEFSNKQVCCEELEKSLDNVKKQLEVTSRTNEELVCRLEVAAEEKENLKSKCDELQLALTVSAGSLAAIEDESNLLKCNYKELETRLSDALRVLTADLNDKKLECNNLCNDKKQLVEQLQASEENHKRIQEDFCRERTESSNLRDQLETKDVELEEMRVTNIEMLASHEFVKNGLENQLESLTAELNTVKLEFDKLKSKLIEDSKEFTGKLEEKQQEYAIVKEEKAQLLAELQSHQASLVNTQEKLHQAELDLTKLTDKLHDINKIELERDNLLESREVAEKELKSQLEIAVEENETFKLNLQDLQTKFTENLAELTKTVESKELECNLLIDDKQKLLQKLEDSESKLVEVQQKLSVLEKECTKTSDQLELKDDELESLQFSLHHLKIVHQQSEKTLQSQLDNATRDYNALQRVQEEAKIKFADDLVVFAGTLEEKQNECILLQKDKAKLLSEMDSLQSDHVKTQEKLVNQEADLCALKVELKQKQLEINEIELSRDNLRNLFKALGKEFKCRVDTLVAELKNVKITTQEFRSKIVSDFNYLRTQLQTCQAESKLLLDELRAKLEVAGATTEGNHEILTSLKGNLAAVSKQLNDKERELHDLESKYANSRDIQEQQRVEFEAKLATVATERDGLESSVTKLTDALNIATITLGEKENERLTLISEKEGLHAELETARTEQAAIQAKLCQNDLKLAAINEEFTTLQLRCTELKSTETINADLKSQLEQVRNEIGNVSSALKLSEATNEELQTKVVPLESRCCQQESEIVSLTQLTKEQKLEIYNLQTRYDETKMQLQSAENKIHSLQAQLQKSEEFLSSFKEDMGAITIKYDETCEKCGALLKEKLELEEKVELLATVTQEKLSEVGSQLKAEMDRSEGFGREIEELNGVIGDLTKKLDEKANLLNIHEESARAYDLVKCEQEELSNKVQTLESQMTGANQEIRGLHEKLDKLETEKMLLIKKIEDNELEAVSTQETLKSFEETIQDYEITISGLKKVVDTDLETQMSLKNDCSLLQCETEAMRSELFEVKSKEEKTLLAIFDILKGNQNSSVEDLTDLESNIFDNLRQLLDDKKRAEESVMELEAQIEDKVKTLGKLNEMTEKLQVLVLGKADSFQDIETCVANIYEKIDGALRVKAKLDEESKRLAGEKLELIEKLKKANDEIERISKENLLMQNQNSEKIAQKDNVNIILKSQKENVPTSDQSEENEWKKKSRMLKQKLVLTESAKNKLEEKIKLLREENKKLSEGSSLTSDVHYKMLLQEHIKLKEQVANLKETPIVKSEDEKKMSQDLKNIRDAYTNVMSTNSKLELDNVTLRKVIEERNTQVSDLYLIKDAYEKLLEENNKIITEIDTIKYKRMRDKDEYLRLLKKEREDANAHEGKRVQEVRVEYEGKLEKMKDKMLKLYRDEVNKEVQKMKAGQNENNSMTKIISDLRSELFEAGQKLQLLEMERDMLRSRLESQSQFYLHDSSRNSVASSFSRDSYAPRISTVSTRNVRQEDPRRASTLPRSVVEEISISRRTSVNPTPSSIGHNVHMEDEDDDFNNKYLTDLKEGRCAVPATGRGSTADRVSELAWRNSLLPPHLKSSYAAEVQFVSPNHFKEDDIKTGHIEFDTSMCRLLPGDKPRKKDFGTTSYKKPGPPTPIKNGGRLSLQGNEVHPLREIEIKTPKRSTPSRIRALFAGKNNSTKEHSDVQSGTPVRNKRLHIFRRPK